MQETPAELKKQTWQDGSLSLSTLWPQFVAGLVFAGTVLWAIQHPEINAFPFIAGSGSVFLLTISYLYSLRKGWNTATSLLTWAGGLVLTILSALILPNFLAYSVVFVFASVCYGLGASSRRAMMIGTITMWLALAVSLAIYLLVNAGVVSTGITQPPLMWQVFMCVVCLLLTADVMQRLWRHYNRTESAFEELRRMNRHLNAARATLTHHVKAQSELLDVSRVIRSTQDQEPLLDEILAQMKRVVNYSMASVLVIRNGEVIAVRYAGQPIHNEQALITALISTPQWKQMVEMRRPVVLDDLMKVEEFYTPFVQSLSEGKFNVIKSQHSWLCMPMIVRGEVIGGLSITHSEIGYFIPARVEWVYAFANHAAVAIDSARTREDAVNAAALTERARLARELHDSVSQALYGMVLTTRTSLELFERNPAKAQESMRYTLELADAALSEMRALIFELRPESLREEGLLAALSKQAAALTARHKIKLLLDLCDKEPAIPIKTKEALYRIGMEAIQNTIRHAGASTLHIEMICDGGVKLMIEDNGCGFDTQGNYPGHLGLQSMRERAQALGGDVVITSQIGEGTCVHITIPPAKTATPTSLSAGV